MPLLVTPGGSTQAIEKVPKGQLVYTDLGGLSTPTFGYTAEGGKGARFLIQFSVTEHHQTGPVYHFVDGWDLQVLILDKDAYIVPDFRVGVTIGKVLQGWSSGLLVIAERRQLPCAGQSSKSSRRFSGRPLLFDVSTGDVLDQQIVENVTEVRAWKMFLQLGPTRTPDDLLICDWKVGEQ